MNKSQLKVILQKEKVQYCGDNKSYRKMKTSLHKRYIIWKTLYYFRLCQYYKNTIKEKKIGLFAKLFATVKYRYYNKRRNLYYQKSGVEIALESSIGVGCDIWHGGVVINGNLGDGCVIHGNNIIGNKGIGLESEKPTLGNGVDIGAGAVIIGKLEIADDVIIGANSVVTKSFLEPGSIVIGVPGQKLRK